MLNPFIWISQTEYLKKNINSTELVFLITMSSNILYLQSLPKLHTDMHTIQAVSNNGSTYDNDTLEVNYRRE